MCNCKLVTGVCVGLGLSVGACVWSLSGVCGVCGSVCGVCGSVCLHGLSGWLYLLINYV